MIATQLFVVPRSMPMIFAIFDCLRGGVFVWTWKWGFARANQRSLFRRLRYGDERRAQHAVVQQVALLEDGHDGVGRELAVDRLHRLMQVRVELLPGRVDLLDRR